MKKRLDKTGKYKFRNLLAVFALIIVGGLALLVFYNFSGREEPDVSGDRPGATEKAPDVSGKTRETSEETKDVSGKTREASEETKDVSGKTKKASEEVESVDVNTEHIKLELMKNVSVDAEITPYSKYKEGLSSYYLKTAWDSHKKTDMKAFKKNPVIFGQKVRGIAGSIKELNGGSFDWKKQKFNDQLSLTVPYLAESGEKKNMECWWAVSKEGRLRGTEITLESYDPDTAFDITRFEGLGIGALTNDLMYDKKDLGFASSDEVISNMRALVEKITSRKLAEEVHCVPVTEGRFNTLTKAGQFPKGSKDEKLSFPGEYYTCIMYHEVDGFPWKALVTSEEQGAGTKLSDDIFAQEGYMYARNESPQVITYNKDGIMKLTLDSCWYPGKLYKKKEKVCTVEEVLEQVSQYFEHNLNYPVTIYDISINYASYFTDREDGPVKNVVRPFWVVKYWGILHAKQIVFDAYTGKHLSVGNEEVQ